MSVFFMYLSDPKVVSPYSGYSGQLRSSVYQPTELAIISKGMGNVSTGHQLFVYMRTHARTHTPSDCCCFVFQLSLKKKEDPY